ncbi:MFS general substrate transporter [Choiromyces venosus 120613-1]|uniref:MFS general substrate transporter n=1 Tax=Choiromyces venosus 120613-1 TaxID=1336337 RepID=A0A3N4IYB9_9PEZI|nr:MFS general substrate transporter [Choiromyces venosus 120613-1]
MSRGEITTSTTPPAPEAAGRSNKDVLYERKGIKVLGIQLPPWRSPLSQVILTGFVCFLCPGMFNALSGLGAGGQVDSAVQANASVALYTTFAFVGFIAGTVLNYFGAQATLAFGGLGYAVYSASFLSYNHTKNEGFVLFAGAFLGVCAGFLWCAQGTVMMSYPTESEKGRYIGLFWAIFNMGGVIGSCIPIATNWHNPNKGAVNDGTYVGFLVLMLCGAVLAFFLVPPEKIIRKDGTRVQRIRHPSMKTEIWGLWETIKSDSYILLLFPFFWASNWFYTYQQNCYQLFYFNLRGRTFTNLWYWLAQIFGALAFGFFLDNQRIRRRKRAIYGWIILFVAVNAIVSYSFGLLLDISNLFSSGACLINNQIDKDFTWYLIMYMVYGFQDAMWQTYAYWMMGALSNEPRKLAYFAGFYKGIQSAGAAVVWRLDAVKYSYATLFGSSWGLCGAGMLLAIPVIWYRIRDTELTEEDFVTPAEKDIVMSKVKQVASSP